MGKATCKLECPKCHKVWGKMKYQFDSRVSAADIIVTAGKKKKFKNGDDLACTLCQHPYTNYDVMLAIAGHGAPDGTPEI